MRARLSYKLTSAELRRDRWTGVVARRIGLLHVVVYVRSGDDGSREYALDDERVHLLFERVQQGMPHLREILVDSDGMEAWSLLPLMSLRHLHTLVLQRELHSVARQAHALTHMPALRNVMLMHGISAAVERVLFAAPLPWTCFTCVVQRDPQVTLDNVASALPHLTTLSMGLHFAPRVHANILTLAPRVQNLSLAHVERGSTADAALRRFLLHDLRAFAHVRTLKLSTFGSKRSTVSCTSADLAAALSVLTRLERLDIRQLTNLSDLAFLRALPTPLALRDLALMCAACRLPVISDNVLAPLRFRNLTSLRLQTVFHRALTEVERAVFRAPLCALTQLRVFECTA